jgi:hypothetical protein
MAADRRGGCDDASVRWFRWPACSRARRPAGCFRAPPRRW